MINESRFVPATAKTKLFSGLSALNSGCDHMTGVRFQLTSVCLAIFITLVLLSANARANIIPLADVNTILFDAGGILNGQSVEAAGTTITVNPGEVITGTVNINVFNSHNVDYTSPVGATVTWGDRATQSWGVTVGGVPGQATFQTWTPFTVNFSNTDPDSHSLTAPLTAGLYHIIFANRAECKFGHVMSATNWKPASGGTNCGGNLTAPVWNDGNDLGWDWTASQFQDVQSTGHINQATWFQDSPEVSTPPAFYTDTVDGYGANWIAIRVVPVPAAVWLFVSGLLGVIGVARCNKHKRLPHANNLRAV